MKGRFNNKILLVIFLLLLGVYYLTEKYRVPDLQSTIRENVVQIDTAEVHKIELYPEKSNKNKISLKHSNTGWKLYKGDLQAAPSSGIVDRMLGEFDNMKVQQLATRKKEKWNKFDVTDTGDTKVKLLDKEGNKITELIIGGITYQKPSGQQSKMRRMRGRRNVRPRSYVRVSNEENVYVVDGFLRMTFNQNFNDLRNSELVSVPQDKILGVMFSTPEEKFNISRKDSIWYVNNEKADSAATQDYLKELSEINGKKFADNYSPSKEPEYTLNITRKRKKELKIDAYRNDTTFILHSSQNPGTYFKSGKNGIFNKLFKKRDGFLK